MPEIRGSTTQKKMQTWPCILLLLCCGTILPTVTRAFSYNAWPFTVRTVESTKPTTHLSASSTTTSTSASTSKLTATLVDTHIYTTLVDGPCWQALQETPLVVSDSDENGGSGITTTSTTKHGALSIVTGTLADTQEAVVALLAEDEPTDQDNSSATSTLTTGECVWTDSVARLPSSSSSRNAAATMALALTTLYPLLATQATAVGGSPTTEFLGLVVPPKVVVMGGNPLAVWAAQALTMWQKQSPPAAAATAIDTFMVTTNKPPSGLSSGITVLSGKDDQAFCQRVGQFDAVLDTVGSESTSGRSVMLLKRQHGCSTYRSTRTQAETVVASQGLLFGPGKAKKYLKDFAQKTQSQQSATTTPIRPVPGWGRLVEQLWDVPLPTDIFQTVNQGSGTTTWVRGWSLPDMWESTTWPSNTDGTRYGFPTMEDEEEEEEDDDDDYSAIASIDTSSIESEESIPRPTASASSSSPYIIQIYGDEGLKKDIVEPELDCILFMAAPYCRTCQKLRSPYARLARLNFEDDESDVVFAKADIVGKFGKSLGQSLGVKAVPTFLLFRNGQRFGKPLTISKLPNPQLDMALKYLKERTDWNDDDDKQFSATSSKQDEDISVKGITLKIAIDSQGGVADLSASKSDRFTSPASLDRVHRLRRTAQAVLVGRGTVAFDNPSLTIRRDVPAPSRPPLRVVLDSQLSLCMERVEHGRTFQLLEDGLPTVVYHAVKDADDESLNLFEQTEIVQVPLTENDQLDVMAVWKDLQTRLKVSHLMVEGGPATARSFLQAGLVNRVMLVQAKGVTFEKPVPSEIDAESLSSFGLERLGSFEEEGDVTECWARPGEDWPTEGLDEWP